MRWPVALSRNDFLERLISRLQRHAEWLIAGGVGAFTLTVLLVYEPWGAWSFGDIALFQVFGRLIANGDVPYRDFFDHKTPLVFYLNAFPALISRIFGTDYVLGARALSIALMVGVAVATYLLCRQASFGRLSSFGAAATFSAFYVLSFFAILGLAAKAAMSYMGILALLAAYRSKWLLSGLSCGLAFLTWQPAIIFVLGVAARAVLAEPRHAIPRSTLAIGIGTAVPIVAILSYFLAVGAIDEFWTDTVLFNREYVNNHRTNLVPIDVMADRINDSYSAERWLFLLGLVGFSAWAVKTMVDVSHHGHEALASGGPLAVVTLGVFGYSCFNFTTSGDVLPFLPWVAIWSAYLLHVIERSALPMASLLTVVGMLGLIAYGHHDTWDELTSVARASRGAEQTFALEIEREAGLEEGDPIFVVNESWFLLITDRDHLSKYLYTRSGVDRFVADREGYDEALLEPILNDSPRLVVLSRQEANWLEFDGYSPTQHIFAPVLLWKYQQIPRGKLPFSFANRAEFWILRPEDEQEELRRRFDSALATVGTVQASELLATEGSPLLKDSPDVGTVWALGGRSGREALGGVELTVPEDIDIRNSRLALQVDVALSEEAGPTEEVALLLSVTQQPPPSSSRPADEVTTTILIDASAHGALEHFTVHRSPRLFFRPGDTVRVVLERAGDRAEDTYPGDVLVRQITVSYLPSRE